MRYLQLPIASLTQINIAIVVFWITKIYFIKRSLMYPLWNENFVYCTGLIYMQACQRSDLTGSVVHIVNTTQIALKPEISRILNLTIVFIKSVARKKYNYIYCSQLGESTTCTYIGQLNHDSWSIYQLEEQTSGLRAIGVVSIYCCSIQKCNSTQR